MRGVLAGAVALLVGAAPAEGQVFPARSGESGILDVPDADVTGAGGGQLAAELRFDHAPGAPDQLGPLPLYAVGGAADRLDLGFSVRSGGQPGDPRPVRTSLGAAAKLQLWGPSGFVPGAALSVTLDGLTGRMTNSVRAALSTERGAFRLAAFAGAEIEGSSTGSAAATWGVAGSVALSREVDLVADAVSGPRGDKFGFAVRQQLRPTVGAFLGFDYLPKEEGFRVSLGVAFGTARKTRPAVTQAPEARVVEAPTLVAEKRFSDDRPRFRMRIPSARPDALGAPRSLQHGPIVARATGAATAPAPVAAPGARSSAPSLEDLAEAQTREQETLADTRERRIRNTAEQLDEREKTALDEQKRLADRERELAAREQQLDARTRLIPTKGPATLQQRQLESVEAQLASQERNLAAQERSFGPTLDAAQGRQRDATAREETERQDASRLAASASGASSRAVQIDTRKLANAAKSRQLAAMEARLLAKGEYIDAIERQLRTKSERIGAWSRRLDARAERLDLGERLGAEPKAPPPSQKPAGPTTGAATPKDKAAFVMVVKSPTAIVKERPAVGGGPAAAPSIHPGAAVEKAVAAATVLMFPTPATQMSELDVEALNNIAKLAARERCELLIWARAKDPGSMAEAQRRATDIQTRAVAAGPLDPNQVVTRITVRPGAKGVDVVVSALRETAKPAAAPAQAETPKLLSGESGNRQLREAVQAAQGSIEACVAEFLEARRLSRAEGVLKVTVSATGRVSRVTTGAGDLSGAQIEECLGAASREWRFPSADGEYVVDVPITVIRGGAPK